MSEIYYYLVHVFYYNIFSLIVIIHCLYTQCYEWVLYKAVHMDWAEDSAKALVIIGDCLPHPRSYTDQEINWHDQLDLLKGMGVKVLLVKIIQYE